MIPSCTPHSPRARFHISYEDFYVICGCDVTNASALRVLETKTNARITYLREKYGIPMNMLPHEDDLWLDGVSTRELERRSVHIRNHSSYERALREENDEDTRPSLVQQGFLRFRFIARPGAYGTVKPVATQRYQDESSVFIVVLNAHGDYLGSDGKQHNAACEGFTEIYRQDFYHIEAVNAAIARFDGLEPPEPLPRCGPVVTKKIGAPATQVTTNPYKASDAMNVQLSSAAQGDSSKASDGAVSFAFEDITADDAMSIDHVKIGNKSLEIPGNPPRPILEGPAQNWAMLASVGQGAPMIGGELPSFGRNIKKIPNKDKESKESVKREDSALPRSLSSPLYASILDFNELRRAPWSAETIIALAAKVLPVPDPQSLPDDDEAKDAWYQEWQKPAERLMAATCSLSPQLAWECIDLTTRYMVTPGSPSWWQQGRTRQSATTLRHVANNIATYFAEFKRSQWWPVETTPYDGPPLIEELPPASSYEAGYGGVVEPETNKSVEIVAISPRIPLPPMQPVAGTVVTASSVIEQQPGEAAVIAPAACSPPPAPIAPAGRRLPGMRRWAAEDLVARIETEQPVLSTLIDIRPLDSEFYIVGLEFAPGQCFVLRSIRDWISPPPKVAELIAQAVAYASSKLACSSPPVEEQG